MALAILDNTSIPADCLPCSILHKFAASMPVNIESVLASRCFSSRIVLILFPILTRSSILEVPTPRGLSKEYRVNKPVKIPNKSSFGDMSGLFFNKAFIALT